MKIKAMGINWLLLLLLSRRLKAFLLKQRMQNKKKNQKTMTMMMTIKMRLKRLWLLLY